MLRIEKIFDEKGIIDELETYAPLVPDGSNFKATMLIEYGNPIDRKAALAKMIGIEDRMFIRVEGQPRVYAIAEPTKTWNARTTKRPPPFTSSGSSSRPR